jgi:Na+-translocating ferredoxin:NAD+ oxidoreductase RnfD subunit
MNLWQRLDARLFQLAFLTALLLLGALARDFALTLWQAAAGLAAALGTQALWQFGLGLPERAKARGYLSAVVTACSIAILIRSDTWWVHPLVASVAMSSKFVLRFGQGAQRGHVLNPANLACVLALWLLPHAWLSPGQWGDETLAAFWMVALGALVTRRVARWGISVAFLGTWMVLLAARLLWLGVAPELALAQWLHQVQNGSLLLFSLFMISDPMTTPQHARARLAYGLCVAVSAFAWQWLLYRPLGPIVALFFWSWTVPLWNAVFPARRFAWEPGTGASVIAPKSGPAPGPQSAFRQWLSAALRATARLLRVRSAQTRQNLHGW